VTTVRPAASAEAGSCEGIEGALSHPAEDGEKQSR